MTTAILPMKPPGSGKTRLSESFDPSFRAELASAMYSDVLDSLARCRLVSTTLVVTADPTCASMARLSGADVLHDPGVGSHSAAASLGATAAAEAGAERILMIPGDCPALEPAEVDALLGRPFPSAGCFVIPDRHGTGTNALVVAPPMAMEPAFGPGSHRRHLDLATGRGLVAESVAVGSLALDVDTPDDLEALIHHLRGNEAIASRTRSLLSKVDRLPDDA